MGRDRTTNQCTGGVAEGGKMLAVCRPLQHRAGVTKPAAKGPAPLSLVGWSAIAQNSEWQRIIQGEQCGGFAESGFNFHRFSIGGYDADKISGDVVFGVGKKNEPYEGIGRGILNIESLPVFRDNAGAFGTPTSDSVRTAVTSETVRFLMIIIGFGNLSELDEAAASAVNLLEKYAFARNMELKIV